MPTGGIVNSEKYKALLESNSLSFDSWNHLKEWFKIKWFDTLIKNFVHLIQDFENLNDKWRKKQYMYKQKYLALWKNSVSCLFTYIHWISLFHQRIKSIQTAKHYRCPIIWIRYFLEIGKKLWKWIKKPSIINTYFVVLQICGNHFW